jgi:hypothetical protein
VTDAQAYGNLPPMSGPSERAKVRVREIFGLSERVAERVVGEVLDCFRLKMDEFIRLRHEELKRQGLANQQIYEQIANELVQERFVAPSLSARQIRRRIYG